MGIHRNVDVPRDAQRYSIHLIALGEYLGPDGPDLVLAYLQRSRIKALVQNHPESLDHAKKQYEAHLDSFVEQLALETPVDFDAIILAPSEGTSALPYFERIRRQQTAATDLTNLFTKAHRAQAATVNSLEEFLPQLTIGSNPGLPFRNYLIVDDILSNGYTASAIIHRCLEGGARHDAKWSLAVPLVVHNKSLEAE